MIDWTQSMQQSFEYYTVNPHTWKDDKQLKNVKPGSTLTRDSELETRGSATIDLTESVGECYIRVYLIAIQNGVTYKKPLGTYIMQTPMSSFDGKIRNVSVDAYTPLLELKENPPPLGYSILEGENIMDMAYQLTSENVRAPVVPAKSDKTLFFNFIADTEEKWLAFVSDLIANAKHHFDVDEMGRILFAPEQDTASLQPVWTYTDDNSSILQPDFDMEHDLFDVPNVVEVVYTSGRDSYYAKVVNDDPNSPTSTVNRGRQIKHRITNPDTLGDPTNNQIQEYARTYLKEVSTLTYKVTYTHGYNEVRVGDCVRLNYTRAGIKDIKAKVISQNIKCEPGCPVTEKAIFTVKLWGDT